MKTNKALISITSFCTTRYFIRKDCRCRLCPIERHERGDRGHELRFDKSPPTLRTKRGFHTSSRTDKSGTTNCREFH
jgi:hypothetical protein